MANPCSLSAARTALRWSKDAPPAALYCSQNKVDLTVSLVLSKRLRIPLVVHLHYTMGPWLGRFAEWRLRRAPLVIAVSEFVRTSAVLRGVSPGAIHTVHNSLRVDAASEGLAPADLQDLLARPTITAVGRLDPGKGFDVLVEAFAAVRRAARDVELVICGAPSWGRSDAALRELCDVHGVAPHVRFLGYRGDVGSILRHSQVFCLPSELESFGLVYLEAMRAGLPVVALRSGGVPEIVVDGVTGTLVYPGDVAALAEALLTLVDDDELRHRMGEAGRARLERCFTPDVVGARWLALVDAWLAARSR